MTIHARFLAIVLTATPAAVLACASSQSSAITSGDAASVASKDGGALGSKDGGSSGSKDGGASGSRDGGGSGGDGAGGTDGRGPSGDTGAPEAGGFDVIVIGPPDTGVTLPDAATDGSGIDACGICDRVWVCNGFSDHWVSMGPDACADVRQTSMGPATVATLYCQNGDTINYASAMNNAGMWMTTPTGLALLYDNVGGGTVEIDCVPGM